MRNDLNCQRHFSVETWCKIFMYFQLIQHARPRFRPYAVRNRMFLENYVRFTTTDGLPPCFARQSAVIVLNAQNVIGLSWEVFSITGTEEWFRPIYSFAFPHFLQHIEYKPGVTHMGHHDDVIKRKHFPRYWPFVRGMNSPTQRPVTRSFDVFFENNHEAGDLRRYRAHYDMTSPWCLCCVWLRFGTGQCYYYYFGLLQHHFDNHAIPAVSVKHDDIGKWKQGTQLKWLFDGLVQERRNSSVFAMELRLSFELTTLYHQKKS